MQDLLEREGGLVWTAHAGIKVSGWTPDLYRNDRLFHSDNWLGAAWKAMPADLSHDQLGRRVLDLMDDMANWGGRIMSTPSPVGQGPLGAASTFVSTANR